jgi:hypothetical protein
LDCFKTNYHCCYLHPDHCRRIATIRAATAAPGSLRPQARGLQRLGNTGDLDGARAPGDGAEDIARSRESGFDPEILRMDRAFHYAAYARHKVQLFRDRHNAGGRADHVHHVADAAAGADRIPMRIEGAGGNGNAGA